MSRSSKAKKNRRNKGEKSSSATHASNSADPTEAIAKEITSDSSEAIAREITAPDKGQSSQVAAPISENVDLISALDLQLKVHILSYLPTRCAVATSLLSKVWRYVWGHVPELDFNDLPPSITNKEKITFTKAQYASFVKYVYRVLFLQNPQWLQGLSLVMYDWFNASHIYEWMLFIARLNIQEICCISYKKLIISVPPYLFLNKYYLVVLKLEGFRLELPHSPFYLPSLRTFSLSGAIICDSVTDNPWRRLLSNCPVLEFLEIEHCKGFENLSICSSSIKVLRVELEKDPQISILIQTPNLEVLHLSLGIKELEVNDLASINKVKLSISTSSSRWIDLLHRTCCTKSLELYQIILDDPTTTSMQWPTFENLTHLEVGFTSWSVVLQIIRHAHKLASVITHKAMFDWPDRKPSIKNIPLERIEYYGFDGIEGYQELGYFLTHSPPLKRVIVYIPSFLVSTSEMEIYRRLLKLRRASIRCRIFVVYEDCSNSKFEDSGSELESSVGSDGESEKAADIDNDGDIESERVAVSESENAADIDNDGDIESERAAVSEPEKAADIDNDGDIESERAAVSESEKAADIDNDGDIESERAAVSDSLAVEV